MAQPRKKRCSNLSCMASNFDVTTAQSECAICGSPLKAQNIDAALEGIVEHRTFAERRTAPPVGNPMKDFFEGLSG